MSSEREALQRQLRDLEARISRLEASLEFCVPSVPTVLRQRGFRYGGGSPLERVILPNPPTEEAIDQYVHLLGRYSFRIFLRDVIKFREGFRETDLLHYCSTRKVRIYLAFLAGWGIISPMADHTYRLNNPAVYSFGDTLEWYVAQLFQREFAMPASWDVQLLDLPSRGDFDVIAVADRELIYVETKSSPPKNIHQENVAGFFTRLDALKPALAIFLVDTHLRLEDKINVMVRAEFDARPGGTEAPPAVLKKIRKGIFRIAENLFVISTKPSVLSNLRTCLRLFFMK